MWVEDQLRYNQKKMYGFCYGNYTRDINDRGLSSTVVFYSGGLDSVANSLSAVGDLITFVHLDEKMLEIEAAKTGDGCHEPLLLRLARDAGYKTIYLGDTRGLPGYKSNINKLEPPYIQKLAVNLGITLVNPCQTSFRHQVFDYVLDNGLKFNSCFNARNKDEWCGHCYKCWHTLKMGNILSIKLPFIIPSNFRKDTIEKWEKELQLTYNTKVDPVFGDSIDLIATIENMRKNG